MDDINKDYSDLKKSILEEVKVMREEFNKDYSDLKKSILEEVKVMREEFNKDYSDLKNNIRKDVEGMRGKLLLRYICTLRILWHQMHITFHVTMYLLIKKHMMFTNLIIKINSNAHIKVALYLLYM
jgi:hypothetical protein